MCGETAARVTLAVGSGNGGGIARPPVGQRHSLPVGPSVPPPPHAVAAHGAERHDPGVQAAPGEVQGASPDTGRIAPPPGGRSGRVEARAYAMAPRAPSGPSGSALVMGTPRGHEEQPSHRPGAKPRRA